MDKFKGKNTTLFEINLSFYLFCLTQASICFWFIIQLNILHNKNNLRKTLDGQNDGGLNFDACIIPLSTC